MSVYKIDIKVAAADYPDYEFISALTPSAQKAAFHVRDKKSGEELCFKLISPTCDIERVGREIESLMTIAHPNIVKLKAYLRELKPGKTRHFMVEEFVAGADLTNVLLSGKPITLTDAVLMFAGLCDGLFELCKHGIVHRDLKPQNIRIRTADDALVIIDFGLARLLTKPALTSTGAGAQIGTPVYFAPEQWQGTKHDIDHRTDLFAVGLMLFEAVVGKHPFWDGKMTRDDLEIAVCTSTDYLAVPEFQALPPPWKLILSKLLEKERGKRPNDASQVAAFLRKIGGSTGGVKSTTPTGGLNA